MPKTREARPFYSAGLQRLEDARVLLENSRSTGAMYLAGYCVECALKALLIESTPRAQRPKTVLSFRGQLAHSFDWLNNELLRRGIAYPKPTARLFLRVSSWTTDLRYFAGSKKLRDARALLDATSRILEWVERRF